MNIEIKKHYLILGGFVGFLLTFILGIFFQKEPLVNMMHATLGCIVGTLLTQMLLFVIYLHRSGDEEHLSKSQSDNKKA